MEKFDSDVIFSHRDLDRDQEQKNDIIFHGLGMNRFDEMGFKCKNHVSSKEDSDRKIDC